MRLYRQPFFQEPLEGQQPELLAEFLFKFGFGKRKALAAALHGLTHGGKVGVRLQDGFASAPLLDSDARQPLLLVATEPVVDGHLAAAKLLGDRERGALLGAWDLTLEQDCLAAQAETGRRAVPGRFLQGRPLFGGKTDDSDSRHDAYSLTHFRAIT